MRGINHPSVVKLLSFSESPEHYFLVLECKSQRLHFLSGVILGILQRLHSDGGWRTLPPDRQTHLL